MDFLVFGDIGIDTICPASAGCSGGGNFTCTCYGDNTTFCEKSCTCNIGNCLGKVTVPVCPVKVCLGKDIALPMSAGGNS